MMRLQQGFPTSEIGFAAFLHGSNSKPCMSLLGQKQTLRPEISMAALPPKADITERDRHVCFVPKADVSRCSKIRYRRSAYSITSSARPSNGSGMLRPSALAVLRLITRLSLTACITGKSLGFSPLRIRPA
jgi:hypothetical protein